MELSTILLIVAGVLAVTLAVLVYRRKKGKSNNFGGAILESIEEFDIGDIGFD